MKIKFEATGKQGYVMPWVKEDEKGNVVFNKNISFTPGGRTMGKLKPAYFFATEEQAEYMRKQAAFNIDYKEVGVRESEPVKKAQPKPPKKEVKEEVEETEEVEDVEEVQESEEDQNEAQEFPEVNSVQLAAIKLRQLDKSLKVKDVTGKEKVLEVAEKMNVSFPSLK